MFSLKRYSGSMISLTRYGCNVFHAICTVGRSFHRNGTGAMFPLKRYNVYVFSLTRYGGDSFTQATVGQFFTETVRERFTQTEQCVDVFTETVRGRCFQSTGTVGQYFHWNGTGAMFSLRLYSESMFSLKRYGDVFSLKRYSGSQFVH